MSPRKYRAEFFPVPAPGAHPKKIALSALRMMPTVSGNVRADLALGCNVTSLRARSPRGGTMTRLSRLPERFDAPALKRVLKTIGLPLPAGARLHPAPRRRMSACGVRFAEAVVDAALDRTELDQASRIAVKIAVENQGLLRR